MGISGIILTAGTMVIQRIGIIPMRKLVRRVGFVEGNKNHLTLTFNGSKMCYEVINI